MKQRYLGVWGCYPKLLWLELRIWKKFSNILNTYQRLYTCHIIASNWEIYNSNTASFYKFFPYTEFFLTIPQIIYWKGLRMATKRRPLKLRMTFFIFILLQTWFPSNLKIKITFPCIFSSVISGALTILSYIHLSMKHILNTFSITNRNKKYH